MCWLVGWSLGEGRVKTSSGTNVVSRGRLGRVFCPLRRRLVSFWGSAEVICAPLWLKSCHDEARCGQVRARRADGCARNTKTRIFPMSFDDVSKTGVPQTSKMLESHWFCKVFQPSEGSKRSSGVGDFNWTGGMRRAHGGLRLKA